MRHEKKSERVIAKKVNKQSKFWLMRMDQIETLHIFVSNLREIYLFGKNSFFSKT